MIISENDPNKSILITKCNGIRMLTPCLINFEDKTLDDLKQMRQSFNLKEVHFVNQGEAYLIKMIDILLEKIERLENDNQ